MEREQQRRAVLSVTGMTCGDCGRHVSGALRGVGATDVAVDWQGGTARFSWPVGVTEKSLRDSIRHAGYELGSLDAVLASVASGHRSAVDYDLLVLGSGAAAFAAAIKARDAGRSVAMVEAGTLGGSCVNIGCVPSKTLLRAGETVWHAGYHPFTGVAAQVPEVDLAALVAAKDELVSQLRQAKYADLVEEYGIDVLTGQARFIDADTIAVGDRELRAEAILVATGAIPAVPPISGLVEAGYLTSTTALELKEVPRRLAVIGANAIGLELGQFFVHVGATVSFIDVADRVAPFEEPEASEALTGVLLAQGAEVYTGAQVQQVRREGDIRVLTVTEGDRRVEVEVDEILVATGRRANTDDLNLQAAGVAVTDRGAVVVDERLRTSNPRVWAAGDVTAAPQFVYVSAYHGALAAENALLGGDRTVDLSGLPRVTFTTPPIAGAGLTEATARDAGLDVTTAVLPLSAVPRALVNRDTRGVIKLVADAATNRLLGATIVGDAAGEAIQTAVLAIRAGMTTDELAATFHPYLTMAEGLKLAAQTFDRDVHKLSCCAA